VAEGEQMNTRVFAAGMLMGASLGAQADPFVYMTTSRGYLLRAQLGASGFEVIGNSSPDWLTTANIITLETGHDGRFWSSYTYSGWSDGSIVGGVIAEINRTTGLVTPRYAMNQNSNFGGGGGGLNFAGGMALHDDGTFWMLNWDFGGTGPVFLHQIDIQTGEILNKVLTEMENKISGAMVFRNDGMLVNLAYSQGGMGPVMSVINPVDGRVSSQELLQGPTNITGLTQYEGQTYLSTQYGPVYRFDFDTLGYELVWDINAGFLDEYGTIWGITVNPTPGTITPVLLCLGLVSRRRRV
jgi:hypothetical protein